MNNIRNIDLNLLVTLEALLTERNVTRAARRLHLSQPSVSVQLRKLRRIFADPLLSPAPGGMLPTTRAQALLQPLQAALAGMRDVLEPRHSFDPATAQLTWQVAAADYAEPAPICPNCIRAPSESASKLLCGSESSEGDQCDLISASGLLT
jgi:DNA-binding transcriptional LysR family regulator